MATVHVIIPVVGIQVNASILVLLRFDAVARHDPFLVVARVARRDFKVVVGKIPLKTKIVVYC